jgi:predicted membrane channel-forming protein YqfA (hemolysin III family)
MIFLIIAAFVLLALADFPALVKQKKWYEFTVLSVFFLSAFVLAILQSFEVKIPSPIKGAEYIIRDLLHLTYGDS